MYSRVISRFFVRAGHETKYDQVKTIIFSLYQSWQIQILRSFEEVVHNFGKSDDDLIQWKSGFMANSGQKFLNCFYCSSHTSG